MKAPLFWCIALFVTGIGYVIWLDAGCGELGGMITWEGKVCVDEIIQN